jgi:hypothetical protein
MVELPVKFYAELSDEASSNLTFCIRETQIVPSWSRDEFLQHGRASSGIL